MTLEQALEQQRAAEAALVEAKKATQAIALEQYKQAREACYAAGVELPALAGQKRARPGRPDMRTPEMRARIAAAKRAEWAALTPEARAVRLASMQRGRAIHAQAVN